MDIFINVVAILLGLIGVIGSFLPIVPGPPLGFLGLLVLQWKSAPAFTTSYLIIWLAVVIVITALDYVVPLLGTKKWGGSKYGIWGSTIGLVLGLFFFPPFGFIIGSILGAYVGELIYQKDRDKAFRAAIGSFIGFLAGTALKLVATLIICYQIVVNGFF